MQKSGIISSSSGETRVQEKVRHQAERGAFFAQLLSLSPTQSSDLHEDFIKKVGALSEQLRQILADQGRIEAATSIKERYWESVRGSKLGFIDGGVARIDIPTSAPMGIRVGSYCVTTGDSTEDREAFDVRLSLVDDLFSAESTTYEDAYEDIDKLSDAARIISEAAAVLQLARERPDLDAIFLHGPLINPIAPYGTPGFPEFKTPTASVLTGRPESALQDKRDRHFVRAYTFILEQISELEIPVLGVIERSKARSAPLIRAHLQDIHSKNALSKKNLNRLLDLIEEYRLTDVDLLSIILEAGERTKMISVNRQKPESKWPDEWRSEIRAAQDANTAYVKITETSTPFRVEMCADQQENEFALEMIYHTSKLLPGYAFPVGLDIVDKYAKVPAWMSAGIKNQHATVLLKHALKTGDQKAIEYAKRILASKGRDWLFRPKS